MKQRDWISEIAESTVVRGILVIAGAASLISLGYALPRESGEATLPIESSDKPQGSVTTDPESPATERSLTARPTSERPSSSTTQGSTTATTEKEPAREVLEPYRVVAYGEYSPEYDNNRNSALAGEFEDVLDYRFPSSTDPVDSVDVGGQQVDEYLIFTYIGGVYTAFLGPANYVPSWQTLDINAGKSYSRFVTAISLDDTSSTGLNPYVTITDEAGSTLFESEISFGERVNLDLDIEGILRIKIEVYYPPPTEQEHLQLVFAEPTLVP